MIFLGSLILTLPICSAEGTFTPYIDALFTSTTSVCVTGLVTVNTAGHWSLFGQIIILLLIQFGGMGVVAFMMMVLVLLHRRIGLKNRLLIQQSYGLESIQGVVNFVIRVIRGMLIVEFIGFLCYLPVLCRDYGVSGVWKSLFLSVSAFCNAGMDLLGEESMTLYAGNLWMNLVPLALIVLAVVIMVIVVRKDMRREKEEGKRQPEIVVKQRTSLLDRAADARSAKETLKRRSREIREAEGEFLAFLRQYYPELTEDEDLSRRLQQLQYEVLPLGQPRRPRRNRRRASRP